MIGCPPIAGGDDRHFAIELVDGETKGFDLRTGFLLMRIWGQKLAHFLDNECSAILRSILSSLSPGMCFCGVAVDSYDLAARDRCR